MQDERLYRGLTLVFLSLTLGISAAFRRRADQAGGALRGERGLLWRTPQEEARLIEAFGEEYRSYMRRTGRFFPRLRVP